MILSVSPHTARLLLCRAPHQELRANATPEVGTQEVRALRPPNPAKSKGKKIEIHKQHQRIRVLLLNVI